MVTSCFTTLYLYFLLKLDFLTKCSSTGFERLSPSFCEYAGDQNYFLYVIYIYTNL